MKPTLYGAIIGDSILMPVGVQLTSWRRGSFPLFLSTLLAVGVIAVLGLIAAFATGLGGFIIAIPVLQLIGCIAIHRTGFRSFA